MRTDSPVQPELPPLIPREILFGNPQRLNPQVSPDGKYLAFLAPDGNDVLQVWLQNLKSKDDDRIVTVDKKRGIRFFYWTYHPEQLIYLQDTAGDENWHLYCVNIKTKIVRDLTPFQGIQASFMLLDPNFTNEILVGLNLKDLRRHDVYRINLKNGAVELDTENPGNVIGWVVDSQFKVRAGNATASDGGREVLYRQKPEGRWTLLRHWGPNDFGIAANFSSDGQTLYLIANHNSDTRRLIALDLSTSNEQVIMADAEYDLHETFIHPVSRVIQAVSFYKEKLEWQVLDKTIAQHFDSLSKIRRGDVRVVSRDLGDSLWVVSYTTDDGPVYYYTYEPQTKSNKLLFSHRPALENLPLAEMKPVSLQSRDGLTIHGYLTLPVGLPAADLPLVLLPHGGPWLRDTWGFNTYVQWLSNRGYAVLQVNFRGSTGYGKTFFNAGNREWGGKMHDDLIDGVNWAIQENIADPKKIAIFGGSYGGYAVLAGLTFTPNVFVAGVDIVGPSNLVTLMKTIPPYWTPIKAEFAYRLGDVEKEEEFLKSRSPLFFCDKIRVPLLIGQGANDPRVKQAESEQIVEAMRKANLPVEYVLYTDEGHGFKRPENSLHFFAIAEEFLSKYLGGRFEPMGQIKDHSGIIK